MYTFENHELSVYHTVHILTSIVQSKIYKNLLILVIRLARFKCRAMEIFFLEGIIGVWGGGVGVEKLKVKKVKKKEKKRKKRRKFRIWKKENELNFILNP